MLSPAAVRDLRAYHRALGDVTRLRIVQLLATEGAQTAGQLRRRLGVSQPLFSWHLRRLRRAGIVRAERIGREVRCTFERERFVTLHERGFRVVMNGGASTR